MSVAGLSASTQNYLKAIWSLGEWSTAPVTPTAVAQKTGVRLSTASDALRKLAEQGLVEHAPYGAVVLTPAGVAHAVAMVRRHRLIEAFLVRTLGYRWDEVHDEAETLEHAVSDLMIDRIDALLGRPQRDPHGDPIPGPDGVVVRPDAVPLTELPASSRGRVERISDEDPGLLQYFADRGIGVGTRFVARAGAPYSDAIELAVDGAAAPVPLGPAAAGAVWVSAEPDA